MRDPVQDIVSWHERLRRAPGGSSGWSPPVDVYETADEYVLVIELAGLDAHDFGVHATDDALTVSGRARTPAPATAGSCTSSAGTARSRAPSAFPQRIDVGGHPRRLPRRPADIRRCRNGRRPAARPHRDSAAVLRSVAAALDSRSQPVCRRPRESAGACVRLPRPAPRPLTFQDLHAVMNSVPATRLRKGNLVKHNGDLCRVVEQQHVTPGQPARVRSREDAQGEGRLAVRAPVPLGRHGGARVARRAGDAVPLQGRLGLLLHGHGELRADPACRRRRSATR